MLRTEKLAVAESFRDSIDSAQSVILTEFRGLTVLEADTLRSACRKNNVTFRVIKNTLAKHAISGTPLESVSEHLVGPTAWAYSSEDPVTPAKVVMDFLKDKVAAEHLTVKAGFLDGKTLSAADVEALAKMPGKDELRAKLLSVFQAPGTQMVRVLAARPVEFLNVLKAYADKLEAA